MKHKGKLEIIERLKHSINGNPRFLLRVGDCVCRTAPDSSLGYSVQNWEGQKVVATIKTYYGKATVKRIRKA